MSIQTPESFNDEVGAVDYAQYVLLPDATEKVKLFNEPLGMLHDDIAELREVVLNSDISAHQAEVACDFLETHQKTIQDLRTELKEISLSIGLVESIIKAQQKFESDPPEEISLTA